ncbi:MAG: Gfo/Idh/MocA family oxidoreductase [Clostridia bacterium]|nr:Gfo/Idh/MocA family oxidoreductase [Clostridia bacterium]
MKKNKLRVGIIGLGSQGSVYAGFFKAGLVKNGTLAAVCDLNREKMEAQAKKLHLKCRQFTDYRELLQSGCVDAVIVTTPHYLHPEIVCEAVDRGIHVMSDKPAGVYTLQVKEAIRKAQAHPEVYCGLMLNQRTHGTFKKMKQMIADGEIGEIKRVNWLITDWYRAQSYFDASPWKATWVGEGGGVLFNQSPHQLDLLQWIVGMMPVKIRAFCHFGKWHDIETEDDVTAYLEFENGATGTFVTSTGDYPGANRLEILGTKGKLVCTDARKLVFYKSKQDEREFNAAYKGGFGTPGKKKKRVFTKKISVMHLEVINDFVSSVCDHTELKIGYSEGLNGVEIADAMLLSQWLDREVTLPIDDALYYAELQKRIANSSLRDANDAVLNTIGTY